MVDKCGVRVFVVYVFLVAFPSCSLFHIEFLPRGRFSLHSIVYNTQVTYKQAADFSLSHVYFEMINPANVAKIFAGRASNLLFFVLSNNTTATNTVTNRESEVADLLCGVLESITNSHSHTIVVETTLDHELADGD